jgi:Arylsulfotransferase (ASST)
VRRRTHTHACAALCFPTGPLRACARARAGVRMRARACVRMRARAAGIVAAALLALYAAGAAAPAAHAALAISPLPGSSGALPSTQISFLGASASSLSSISVVGSSSGRHSGRLRSYSSATGASFVPRKPFTPGERVAVHARLRRGSHAKRLSSTFTVAQPATIPLVEFAVGPTKASDIQSFRSEPRLRPPVVTIHHAAAGASAPGYIFATPFIGPGQYGPMMFDNAGDLVWFRPLAHDEDAANFRTQIYRGQNDLTWWQGRTLNFGYGLGANVIVNANYRTVATVRAGNGLYADEHEFVVEPDGSAYLLAYSPVTTSLAPAGGPSSGIALDGVIQRIDIRTGLVMWEWHSLGHVDLSESYSKLPGNPANPFDYFHINSLDVDVHGNLLISARNTWALYEINGRTGSISWRLGGKHSDFALGPNVAFAYQHNALWLGNGNVSLFDDEGAPTVKAPSRGEVLALDVKRKTATLVAQFFRSPTFVTSSQGNAQPLPGGRWMVGWGGLPNFTEFNAAGEIIFDAQLPVATPFGEFSYRVYREPWNAQPLGSRPAIAARTSAGATAVYASWNGATNVASWQLLAGSHANRLSPTGATTPRSGFETTIPAPAAAFYEVRALSASGKVLGTSKPVAATNA